MGEGARGGGVGALAFSWTDVLEGTQGAPWLWWAAALVVVVVLMALLLKALGLLPE